MLIFSLMLNGACDTDQQQQINFNWNFSFVITSSLKNYRYSSYKAINFPDYFLTPTEESENTSAPHRKYRKKGVWDHQQDLQKFQLQVSDPAQSSQSKGTHPQSTVVRCLSHDCLPHLHPILSLAEYPPAYSEKAQVFTLNHHFKQMSSILPILMNILKEEGWGKNTRVTIPCQVFSHLDHFSLRGITSLILPHLPS